MDIARRAADRFRALAVYYSPGGMMTLRIKEGLPMSRSGYAFADFEPAEESKATDVKRPEGVQVSPELTEVLHMLEALHDLFPVRELNPLDFKKANNRRIRKHLCFPNALLPGACNTFEILSFYGRMENNLRDSWS